MTRDIVRVGQHQDLPAGHAIQNPYLKRRRAQLARGDREHVAGCSFSHAAACRTQDGLVDRGTAPAGLAHGQNVVQVVARLDRGIDGSRRVSGHRHDLDLGTLVIQLWRRPAQRLHNNDQARLTRRGRIEIHSAIAPGHDDPHPGLGVLRCGQGVPHRPLDLVARGQPQVYPLSGAGQAVQMVVEEDQPPAIRAHSLIHAVAKQETPIEDWDSGLFGRTGPAPDENTD